MMFQLLPDQEFRLEHDAKVVVPHAALRADLRAAFVLALYLASHGAL